MKIISAASNRRSNFVRWPRVASLLCLGALSLVGRAPLVMVLILAIRVSVAAQPTVAVSNLNQAIGTPVAVGAESYGTYREAFSFTTGSSNLTLDSIDMRLSNPLGSPSGFGLTLYGGFDGSGPTGLIGTFAGSSTPTPAGIYSYSLSATLQAGSTYWVVAAADSTTLGSFFYLTTTNSGAEDGGGLAGWSISDQRKLYNTGDYGGWAPGTSSGVPLVSISVSASAIPEPSTYAAIFGAAVLGIAVWRRRVARETT